MTTALPLSTLLAASIHGVPFPKVATVMALGQRLTEHPESGAVGRIFAKAGMDILSNTGKQTSEAYALLATLEKEASWTPVHWDFIEPVVDILASAAGEAEKNASIEKRAFGIKEKLVQFLPTAGPVGKGLLWSMLGLGVGGGAATWALNRDVNTDAAENESMKARIAYYNQVADEIENEVAMRSRREPKNKRLGQQLAGAIY